MIVGRVVSTDPQGPSASADETQEHAPISEDRAPRSDASPELDAPAEPDNDVATTPSAESTNVQRRSGPLFGSTLVGVPPPPAPRTTPARRAVVPGMLFAGDFKILRLLARGGMGAVFEAEQISTGRRRAVKVLRVSERVDEGTRQRFLREARAGALIDSEHVVDVVVAGSDDATNTLWIAMEYLDGCTLGERLARLGSDVLLPQRESWVVLRAVLRGLAKAHTRGVVHRDLKPSNVFLSRERDGSASVKILDFGIACFLEGEPQKVTDPIGTPLWMAPEQARLAAITPSVDVWSAGLLAFRLFSGRSYWVAANSDTPNLRDVLTELLYEPLESATERAEALACPGRLPMGFDAWFSRCVTRDPALRFVDASEALAALEKIAPRISDAPPGARLRSPLPAAYNLDAPPPTQRIATAPMPAVAPRRVATAPMAARPASRAASDGVHARLEDDDAGEAPTVRTSAVRLDVPPIAPSPRATTTTAPRVQFASPIQLAPPGTEAPPPRPAATPLTYRVAVLGAVLVGGVLAIVQAPGGWRARSAPPRVSSSVDALRPARESVSDLAPSTWPAGEVRIWRGAAQGNESRYAFAAVLRMNANDRVDGYISWTVERAAGVRTGEQVRENVEGSYDTTLGTLDLHGTLSTNPIVYAVNAYRLRVHGAGTLDGTTVDASLSMRASRGGR